MNDFKGKVAIVTGSSSGVGSATALQLAEKGFNVVINYSRNEDGAKKTADACEAAGGNVIICQADVSFDDDCCRMVDAAAEKWGRIDALVNNAGTTKFNNHRNLAGLDKEDFLRIYGVNVVGPYQMVRAVEPHMRTTGKGAIVNVASIAAITGAGSSIAYAASKGALVTMTLSLARILGPEIRVNAVCPGFIQGEWLRAGLGDEAYERVKKRREKTAPLGVTSSPETVAEAILYFICGADIVTGETLILDGGHHLTQTPLTRR
jgi:3-oxoacyl-[acyl-carrier protein] reductase